MLKSHERFYSVNGKRRILLVDDELINREMLGEILRAEYEILFASDGKEALETIRNNSATISLVVLDLMMPRMNGFQLMEIMKNDGQLRRIPVIVLTSEKSAEVESLRKGASDFITKPYDMPEVIRARVRRTIELAEDTYIIQNTERDALTGLLNKEFFYRYAEQFDLHHPDLKMDAAVMDINHFHLVNEMYGWAYGDEVLCRVADCVLKTVQGAGGVAGRRDGDVFLLYCPSGTDWGAVHDSVQAALARESRGGRQYIRFGVYTAADRTLEIERRFDRAKLAADTIRDNYARHIARYDSSLHEKEFLSERLIDDMETALAERQFKVYYQPKYNITGDRPVLRSAEALIRWQHPQLGTVSPGLFIPLFERNGLIQKLDRFVWREAAAQLARWRGDGLDVSVSVNVSRIDMYAPDFVPLLTGLMEEFRLDPARYYLEITESAYTEDSDQLIRTVTEIRERGFRVEMDDFGSGYSSLNMLAMLPIDALKLDMQFIRNLHSGEKNQRMLELMVDIARYLAVPVIAEGVETEEQVMTLKKMGCQMIQGYYFSRPLPPEDFEQRLRRERGKG